MRLEYLALGLVLVYSVVHALTHFRKVSYSQFLHNDQATGLRQTCASAVAGNVGAGTIVGIFSFGVRGDAVALYISVCYALGLVLTALLAGLVHRRCREEDAHSLIDFLAAWFGSDTRLAVWVAAGSIFFLHMAAQLLALGAILEQTLGVPLGAAILYAYAIVTLYLLSGGYYSVTRTDQVQFVCIFLTAVLVLFFLDWETLLAAPQRFWTPQHYSPVFILGILLFLAPAAPISIDNWHRVIATRDAPTARKAFLLAAGLCLLVYVSFSLLGLTAPADAREPVGLMRSIFPALLSFFGLLALVMAVVSTMDSTILPLAAPISALAGGDGPRRLRALRLAVFGLMSGIALTAWLLGDVVTGLIGALSSLVTLFPPVLTALFKGRPSALALKVSLPLAILAGLACLKLHEEYAFLAGIGTSFGLFYGIRAWDLRRQDALAAQQEQ